MVEAERVIEFIEKFLTLGHTFLGEPFRLLPFQKDVIEDIYLEDENGERLRRLYLLGLPRKNGKSQLGAAIALYHLVADPHDPSPQVISAAADRAQARLVFDEARRMVEMSPALSEICTVLRTEIRCNLNRGTYRAVSADAGLQQGLNPSAVILDEYHVHKNSDLFDALSLGGAARRSPLMLVISTAGFDLGSPLGRMYMAGLRLDGRRINGVEERGEDFAKGFGMSWYGPTLEQMKATDWTHKDPGVWEAMNPAWSIFPNSAADFTSTLNSSHESAFIRYKLNGWVSSANAFLPAGVWDELACDDELRDGDEIMLGFDGAWKNDSSGLVAVRLSDMFVQVLGHWEAPTNDPDWRTPADEVEAAMLEAMERFTVRELVADPWRFEQSLLRMQVDHGANLVEFSTNSRARMVPCTGSFYACVLDGGLRHDGNPALARHLANGVLKETPQGGVLTKEYKSSTRHIDLAIALVIAIDRALRWRETETVNADDSLVVLL